MHGRKNIKNTRDYIFVISGLEMVIKNPAQRKDANTIFFVFFFCFRFFKYNQQDATLYNILYYRQRSTCFRWFLRPSSGAQKLYTQQLVSSRLATASVGELELTHASGSSKQA